jgi:DNA gyrase subunit A
VYHLKAYEIPEVGRLARGTNIVNLLALEDDENITAVIPMKTFNQEEYLVQVTAGRVYQENPLADLPIPGGAAWRPSTLKDDDELIAVKRTRRQG